MNFPDSSLNFWGNTHSGKQVVVTSALTTMAGPPLEIHGKFISLEKFQYRWYLILEQKSAKIVHINIDHIFSIEESD